MRQPSTLWEDLFDILFILAIHGGLVPFSPLLG